MKTTISGASDDLIEISGAISEEHDYYGVNQTIVASDGTKATIKFDGEWKIKLILVGKKYLGIINSVGHEQAEGHTNPLSKDCCAYSDVLVLDKGIEWVKLGGKTYKITE